MSIEDRILQIGGLLAAVAALIISIKNDALWLFFVLFLLQLSSNINKHLLAKRRAAKQSDKAFLNFLKNYHNDE